MGNLRQTGRWLFEDQARKKLPVVRPTYPECNSWVSPLNLIKSGELMYALIWPPSGDLGFEKVPTKYLQHVQARILSQDMRQPNGRWIVRTLRSMRPCFSAAWNTAKSGYFAHNQCLKSLWTACHMLQRKKAKEGLNEAIIWYGSGVTTHHKTRHIHWSSCSWIRCKMDSRFGLKYAQDGVKALLQP